MHTAATANPEAPSLFRSEGDTSTRLHPNAPDVGGASAATVGDIAATIDDNDGGATGPLTADELAALAVDDRPRTDPFFFDRLNAGQVPPKGAMAQATLISNGHEVLTVPESDLRKAEGLAGCEHCGGDLPARKHTGGKPRRFCSDKCRSAHHAGCSPTSNPNVKPPSNPPPLPKSAPTRDDLRKEAAAIVAEMKRSGIPQELIDRTAKAIEIPEAPSPDSCLLLASQDAVRIKRDEYGNLLIEQNCWPDDDQRIVIHRDYEDRFVDALTDFLGYGGVP
jgi:hypothetical protein